MFVLTLGINVLKVPLWNQKASKRADGAILWDYHVICVQVMVLLNFSYNDYMLSHLSAFKILKLYWIS